MPIYVGSNEVDDLKIGGSQVKEVYVGANKVWSALIETPWTQAYPDSAANWDANVKMVDFPAPDLNTPEAFASGVGVQPNGVITYTSAAFAVTPNQQYRMSGYYRLASNSNSVPQASYGYVQVVDGVTNAVIATSTTTPTNGFKYASNLITFTHTGTSIKIKLFAFAYTSTTGAAAINRCVINAI